MDKEKLRSLKESIADKGLLHPPVLRPIANDCFTLIAGERRIRAMISLHEAGTSFICDGETILSQRIPYTELNDLTEIKYQEAELEENILREDLSWQDKVRATNSLHELRKAQNPLQTKADTAREIAHAHGPDAKVKTVEQSVDRATLIAAFLDDPDVQRAKSDREAFKIVAKKIEAEFKSKLKPPTQNLHTLIEGDFVAEAVLLKSKQFTCIIADPPYGIGADKFGDAATLKHQYGDDSAAAFSFARTIVSESYMLSSMQAYLFLFCDIDLFTSLREHARTVGWKPFRTPIIWNKGSRGHVPEVIGWRRGYEMILCASKGNKKMSRVEQDIIDIPNVGDTLHAAQKPVALYKRLLQLVCVHGEDVLDPCCGAGTIFPAAHELGLKATGVELDPKQIVNAQAAIGELYE